MAGSGRRNADHLLILARAQGLGVAAAAKAAGISERTAFRRLRDPRFVEKERQFRSQVLNEAMTQMAASASLAVATLVELVKSQSENVRTAAAKSLLTHTAKLLSQV